MTGRATLEVVRSITVPLPPARAFALFTERMTDFWQRDHSIGAAEIAEVVVEPAAGGRWFERGVDGTECQWGSVSEWSPPSRLVLLWQIGADWKYDPDFSTEVVVTFEETEPGRTTVELRHRNLENFGDAADAMTAVFDAPDGWQETLGRFAKTAEAAS